MSMKNTTNFCTEIVRRESEFLVVKAFDGCEIVDNLVML